MTGFRTSADGRHRLRARLARTDLTVDRVVSGALTRQRDTVEPVLAALGWPASRLRIDERLDEYNHVGVMALYTSEVTFETATADGERGRALQSTLEEAMGAGSPGTTGTGRPTRRSSAGSWTRSRNWPLHRARRSR